MANAGHTAIKAIIAIGVVAFLFLLITSMALKRTMLKQGEVKVSVAAQRLSPFSTQRADRDLKTIVGLGPREAGSPGIGALRDYLKSELAEVGFTVEERPFVATTPAGEIPMANLSCEVPGDRPGTLIFCTHYDTRRMVEFPFLGANSGASGTAWLLEMARAMGPGAREGVTLEFVWLDGGEGFTEEDTGNYGAKVLAESLRGGEVAAIYLDMIGDCLLRIRQDRDAPEALRAAVWNSADRLRYRRQFGRSAPPAPGAHLVLREAGIPALGLVDFSYGGTALQHQENYHTARDGLDLVCAESLRAVADVIYHALPTIDEDLQKLISVTE